MTNSKRRLWALLSAVAGSGLVAALAWPHFLTASPAPVAVVMSPKTEASNQWLVDMPTALRAARATGKDVVIEFAEPADPSSPAAGSIFDSASFRAAVAKSCILVRLTSSADASPELATQVATWGERLKVTAFPTLALLDSQGRPCAAKPCQPLDGAEALRMVEELEQTRINRDAAFTVAVSATGPERARLLDSALSAVGTYAANYLDVMQQIADADPNNAAGLRSKYEHQLAAGTIEGAIQNEVYPLIDAGNLPAAIARLEQLGRNAHPQTSEMQLLLAFEGQLYFSLGDRPKAVALLDRAIALAPGSEPASKVRAARAQIAGEL